MVAASAQTYDWRKVLDIGVFRETLLIQVQVIDTNLGRRAHPFLRCIIAMIQGEYDILIFQGGRAIILFWL